MTDNKINQPTKQRFIILDALRGLALLGICLANFPEFSLYTFQDSSVTATMSTAGIDTVVKYLQYIFIDGKFYTIFSVLFGIGFSILLKNAAEKGNNGLTIFYRRMFILFLIGLFHLLFIWAGDILILYAFLGFILPLFRNVSNKALLIWATIFLMLPVAIDTCVEIYNFNLAAPAIHATQFFHTKFGITEANFPVWLAQKQSYLDVLRFNIAGSFIRMQEFIEGNRAFKVLGLFLLGLYIGRNRIYANLEEHKSQLRRIRLYGFVVGFPLTALYAWSAMHGHSWGLAAHTLLNTISILPLSLAYIATFCLWYIHYRDNIFFQMLAAPGRMALTNYIMQSVFGMIIFYGIGFGLGATVGLVYVELIAICVFLIQILYSYAWLHKLSFGPLEWIWRMLTYGKWMKMNKE